MSNIDRAAQIIYDTLSGQYGDFRFPTDAAQALADEGFIPPDLPTMEYVKWSDEEHYLSGAEDYDGNEVIMLREIDGIIQVCDVDQPGVTFAPVMEHPKNLTPNGKRYELREVVGALDETIEPNRRRVLSTVEDYENASHGTIVSVSGTVAERGLLGWRFTGFEGDHGSEYMARLGEGVVLRWGPDDDRDSEHMPRLGEGYTVFRWRYDEVKDASEPTAPLGERAESNQTAPAMRVTEQDYENAPEGTIVAEPGGCAWTKDLDGGWKRRGAWCSNHEMAGVERQILRWRWGG